MLWKLRRVALYNNCGKCGYISSTEHLKPPWKILFFGNDTFSLFSLNLLNEEYKVGHLNKLEVVTSAKSKQNVVREYAIKNKLIHYSWPVASLQEGNFDVGVVVSFGKLLPDRIINKFPFGILNIHASLLPRWRGAAPIIHAIANGDKITGVTIMKIKPEKFDIGDIVLQKETAIDENMSMIALHDRLGRIGAEMLMEVLKDLPNYLKIAKPQPNEGITHAPKVTASMAHINWEEMTSEQIHNLSRALIGLHDLVTVWNTSFVKLLDVGNCGMESSSVSDGSPAGTVYFDKSKKRLLVKCKDEKWISVGRVKVVGNRTMSAIDFNNGYINKLPQLLRRFLSVKS